MVVVGIVVKMEDCGNEANDTFLDRYPSFLISTSKWCLMIASRVLLFIIMTFPVAKISRFVEFAFSMASFPTRFSIPEGGLVVSKGVTVGSEDNS